MQPVLALAMRLTGEMARGNLANIRGRLIRSFALAVLALVLIITALALLCAALAVALAHWIGLVPALLSMAAVAAIAAMILMLVLGPRSQAPSTQSNNLLNQVQSELPGGGLTIVLGALAIGLLVGRRKG